MEICRSGDICPNEAVESKSFPGRRLFCQDHQDRLDAVREHMSDKDWGRNPRNKNEIIERFCGQAGCSNRPIYGEEYCEEHNGGD